MITFAICDDEIQETSELGKMLVNAIITEFENQKTFDEDCRCIFYTSGKDLVNAILIDSIDFAFIDIECGEAKGYDIAREILKINKNIGIIYITNHMKYLIQSFGCRILGFVHKGKIYEDMFLPMTKVIEVIEEYKNVIEVICKGVSKTISINNIIVIEVFKHELAMNVSNEIIRFRAQLIEYENRLKPYRFVKISRNTLINCAHIIEVNNESVTMSNGTSYYVSRRKMTQLKKHLKGGAI